MSDGTHDDLTALLERGATLYSAGRTTAAAWIYRKAAELAPQDPTVRFRLAMALWHGEHRAEEALVELKALAVSYPGNGSIHLAIAQIANSLGEREEAAGAAEQALADDPGLTTAWMELVNANSGIQRDVLGNRLHRALTQPGLTDKARRDLLFALGRLLDQEGEGVAAFEHFQAGHALSPRRWNGKADRKTAARLQQLFSPDLMEARSGKGDPDERMIFVIGMPRSGTSLLDRMLAAHARVTSVGETTGIGDVWQLLQKKIGADADAATYGKALDSRMLKSATKAYFDIIGPRLHEPSASRVVDKMPPNHLFTPLIALMFPNARIILMRRHPLDIGLSCYKAGFGFGFDYANDLATMGETYRLFADLIAQWRVVLGARLFEVSYETLVTEPEQEIARVLEHCGLAFDPACVAPSRAGGLIKTASVVQAREPINARSVGRWREVEEQLAPMIAAMGGMDWIEAHAGDVR